MTVRLPNASRKKQEPPVDAPPTLKINCPCGGHVATERRETFQRLLCPQCGEAFFVLSQDKYPPLSNKKSRPGKKKRKGNALQAKYLFSSLTELLKLEIVWGWIAAFLGSIRNFVVRQANAIRRFFTPIRIVIIAIIAVAVFTGSFAFRRQAVDRAEVVLKEALEEGQKASEKGEFSLALTHFEAAKQAVETIGREDTQARIVRQLFRESQAAANLSTSPLTDILSEAIQIANTKGVAELSDYFRLHHADSWLVIDSTVYRTIVEGQAVVRIDFPFLVGDAEVTIDAGAELLEKLLGEREETRVIFAAQPLGMRAELGTAKRWVFELNPEDAFLWSHFDNYVRLGFAPLEEEAQAEARELLQQQSETMERQP